MTKRLHEDFDPGSPRRSWSIVVAGVAILIMALLLGYAVTADGAPLPAHSSSISDVPPSAYRGKHYRPGYEWIRKCIVYRESRADYRVVNRSSGAAGAYQLMPALRRFAARKMGAPGLAGIPANRWSRYQQDRAFWTIVHFEGLKHWRGGNMRCF